jgi:hypothetical protein
MPVPVGYGHREVGLLKNNENDSATQKTFSTAPVALDERLLDEESMEEYFNHTVSLLASCVKDLLHALLDVGLVKEEVSFWKQVCNSFGPKRLAPISSPLVFSATPYIHDLPRPRMGQSPSDSWTRSSASAWALRARVLLNAMIRLEDTVHPEAVLRRVAVDLENKIIRVDTHRFDVKRYGSIAVMFDYLRRARGGYVSVARIHTFEQARGEHMGATRHVHHAPDVLQPV